MKILKILLYNKKSEIVDMKYVKELKICEEYILKQCKLKYATDEPCIIYRTLVINAAHIMLDDYFRELLKRKENKIEISNLPQNISYTIEFPANVSFLEVTF